MKYKRIVVVLLGLSMVMTALPQQTLAQSSTPETGVCSEEWVDSLLRRVEEVIDGALERLEENVDRTMQTREERWDANDQKREDNRDIARQKREDSYDRWMQRANGDNSKERAVSDYEDTIEDGVHERNDRIDTEIHIVREGIEDNYFILINSIEEYFFLLGEDMEEVVFDASENCEGGMSHSNVLTNLRAGFASARSVFKASRDESISEYRNSLDALRTEYRAEVDKAIADYRTIADKALAKLREAFGLDNPDPEAGIDIVLVSTSVTRTFVGDEVGEGDEGRFRVVYDVEALDDDYYMLKDITYGAPEKNAYPGVYYHMVSSESDEKPYYITSHSLKSSSLSTDDTSDGYFVQEGDTRRFTAESNLAPQITAAYKMELDRFYYKDIGQPNSSAKAYYPKSKGEFETSSLFLKGSGTGPTPEYGIDLELVSTSAYVKPADSGDGDKGVFDIEYNIEASGSDVYVPIGAERGIVSTTKAGGVRFNIENGSNTKVAGGLVVHSVETNAPKSITKSGSFYVIEEGDKERFRLEVSLTPDDAGFYRVQLDGAHYQNSPVSVKRFFEIAEPEKDFETASVFLNAGQEPEDVGIKIKSFGNTASGITDENGRVTSAEYEIDFSVTAIGDDLYIPSTAYTYRTDRFGVLFHLEDVNGRPSKADMGIGFSSTAPRGEGGFLVREGKTERFDLGVQATPGLTGSYALQLDSVMYQDFRIDSDTRGLHEVTVSPKSDYKTPHVYITRPVADSVIILPSDQTVPLNDGRGSVQGAFLEFVEILKGNY